jgi:hypothetical protein
VNRARERQLKHSHKTLSTKLREERREARGFVFCWVGCDVFHCRFCPLCSFAPKWYDLFISMDEVVSEQKPALEVSFVHQAQKKSISLSLFLIACTNTCLIYVIPYLALLATDYSFCSRKDLELGAFLCPFIFIIYFAITAVFLFSIVIILSAKFPLQHSYKITAFSIFLSLNSSLLFYLLNPPLSDNLHNDIVLSIIFNFGVNLLICYFTLFLFIKMNLQKILYISIGIFLLDVVCIVPILHLILEALISVVSRQ